MLSIRNFSLKILAGVIWIIAASIALSSDTSTNGRDKPKAAPGPEKKLGAWTAPLIPAKEKNNWMQAVHAAVLPNGKVLLVSGSSNRDRLDQNGKFNEGVDVTNYNVVNNAFLFDPVGHHFQRIDLPPATRQVNGKAHPNDLFCGHHIHLWNGNVLFVSGTEKYYANGDFKGHKLANIYNWKTENWSDAGVMKDGHWYPTLLPLKDGRIAVLGGVTFAQFKISPFLEIYDPFAPANNAWSDHDLSKIANSPFATRVSNTNKRKDVIGLYPRILPLLDGRYVITGHASGGGQMSSKRSYFMTIFPKNNKNLPPVHFTHGPERKTVQRTYVAAINDPNAPGEILVFAGQKGSASLDHGPGNQEVKVAKVVAHMERLSPPTANQGWNWELFEDFLGKNPEDVRIMHNAVTLPTKQILIIGGGNYAYYRPVKQPVLMTFDPKVPGKYRTEKMNPCKSPRLYHNTALLLPDGRVLFAGGNAHRAIRDSRNGKVDIAAFAPGVPPAPPVPSEVWDLEIFSPPYLFIPGPRPEISDCPKSVRYGQKVTIKGKHFTQVGSLVLIRLPSVTHGMDLGQQLTEVKFAADLKKGEVTFVAPNNRHWNTPGYYMLFFVNDKGKPSKAAMIQLGADAKGLYPEDASAKSKKAPETLTPLSVGSKAPAWIDLQGADGKLYSSKDFDDKKILVVGFTSNTCPVAAVYWERMKSLAGKKEYQEEVGFVAININVDQPEESLAAMKESARAKGLPFAYLLDESQQTGLSYGITAVPEFVVLDRNRHIRYRGTFDDHQDAKQVKQAYVKAAIDALVNGKLPTVSQTTPYGCPVNYPAGKTSGFLRAPKKGN